MAETPTLSTAGAQRRQEIVDAYRDARATGPDRGFLYQPPSGAHARAHERLRAKGVIVEVDGGAYLDARRDAEVRRERQTILATALAGVAATLAVTLAALR